MVRDHTDDATSNDLPTDTNVDGRDGKASDTDEQGAPTEQTTSTRRTVLRLAGGAAAVGLGASFGVGSAGAQTGEVSSLLDSSGETTIPAGEYSWGGEGLDIGSGDAVTGEGNPGDVVLNLDSGTMNGTIGGQLQNVVVRGENPEPKAGIDVVSGAEIDGFVWPEGGTQMEDRAFYNPEATSGRATIRNSMWGGMGNNGAYCDKIPMTFENCAAVNNNVSGIRVGHRFSDPYSETTYIRNCLVAVVADVTADAETTPNARGIRVRKPGHIVIENCYFYYKDVQGATYPVDVEDDVPNSTIEIRDCTFYNESDNPIIIDETGGSADVTVENCVVAGPGSHEVDVDGASAQSVDSVSIPTPAALTGYAAANEVEGVDPSQAPWDDSAAPAPSTTSTEQTTTEEESTDEESTEESSTEEESTDDESTDDESTEESEESGDDQCGVGDGYDYE